MSDETPVVNLHRLWHLFRIAHSLGMEMRNRELKELGITRCQATLFFAMRSAGDKATIAELARWTGQRPHGLSALVSRLEAQGLVKRVRDLDRKNLVRVQLTEKGKSAYEAARQRDSINMYFAPLSEDQCHSLAETLDTLIRGASKKLRLKLPPCTPPA